MQQTNPRLLKDLESGKMKSGESKNRWTIDKYDCPYVFISIRASNDKYYTLYFNCTDYPNAAPTSTLWDLDNNQLLPHQSWPKGGRVSKVFNPGWNGGKAIYIPCDRMAINGHENWRNDYPWLIWNPEKGIHQYVSAIYEVLQSKHLEK